MNRLFGLAFLAASFGLCSSAQGRDWIHWRGPEQNGVSLEKGLPGSFDPKLGAKGNVIWSQPYGGRSAPLVLDGKIYIIQGTGGGLSEGERVVCFDEKSGKPLWNYRFNVFLTNIVSSRLGWTTLTADPATKYVYAHSTAGLLLCLDSSGKLIWSHSLTEEFGRISGYGGRIVTPVFDSGLLIIGMVNSSWGNQARGGNRFAAFNGKTGELVWWGESPNRMKGTYYSSPVVAVIGGQRLLITGGADGYIHAFKIRTGELAWSHRFADGVVNGSPIVDGNLVYCNHGEENPGGGPIGQVVCLDAGKVKDKQPKVVWKVTNGRRYGLASAALHNGRLYVPDDSGDLFCFNAKTGKKLWNYRYGSEVRGAPLIADGKLYIFDVKGRLVILTLDAKDPDNEPEDEFAYKFRRPNGLLNETNGTVIAVNGHLYFTTSTDLYCLGLPGSKGECGKYKPMAEEAKFDPSAKPAALRIFPADVEAKASGKVAFQVIAMDASGRVLKSTDKAAWSLPLPPKAPSGAQPPALKGKLDGSTLTLAPMPNQHGYVGVKLGGLTARARVRVVAGIPYSQDFEKVPAGAVPGGWVNTQSKYFVVKLPDGKTVLSKVNTSSRPPFSRANAFITLPSSRNYSIQADVMGTLVRKRLPDIGLVNCRYTLILDGKTNALSKPPSRQVRIVSWEARPRVNVAVDFNWDPSVWYTAKFSVTPKGKTALVRGKVWKAGETEPEKWTVEFEDPNANTEGAAALYGYISDPVLSKENPGPAAYYDNVKITPNK